MFKKKDPVKKRRGMAVPSETEILEAIYAAVRHEARTPSLVTQNPKAKAMNAFFAPIKVFLELPGACEVEARFGVFESKRFKPGVPPNAFQKVRAEIQKLVSAPPTVSNTLVEIKNGVRKIINRDTNTYEFQRKSAFRDDYVDLKELGVRIGASLEKKVPASDFDSTSPPDISRARNRSTYRPWKGLKIEFTEVAEKRSWDMCWKTKYEIEIERVARGGPEVFIEAVGSVAEWISRTPVAVPKPSDKAKVVREFNSLFKLSKTELVSHFPNRPISIKYKDLLKVNVDDSAWDTTIKLDGVRRFLFIASFGAFLCDPFSNKVRKVGPGSDELAGTLVDGELIEEKHAPSFHSFDILFHKGVDVGRREFQKRKTIFQSEEFTQDVVRCLDSAELSYCFKKFYSSGFFYDDVRKALADTQVYHSRGVKTDGLIFQPTLKFYYNYTTWKWKPPELLSIDFYFSKTRGDSYALYVGATPNQKIMFRGDKDFPYTPKDVVVKGGMLGNVSVNHKVVECFYRNGRFIPFRVRLDKRFPNGSKTARSVWRDINNPISQDTIEGRSLKLFRRVSNNQKRALLAMYVPQGGTILDIGSGRGGDLQKWVDNGYSVYGVEPDPQHRKEFKRRLQNIPLKNNTKAHITLLDTIIEDTEGIAKVLGDSRLGAVTAFFSLTYITKNTQTWDGFLRSIDRFVPTGGVFVGAVLDGLQTQRMLSASQGDVSNETFVIKQRYPAEALDSSFLGNEIFVDIKDSDSLVKNQTEYLFNFKFFQKALNKLGFALVKTEFFSDLPSYKNLPADSKIYSQLVRSFVFKRVKKCADPFIEKFSRCLSSLFTQVEVEEVEETKGVEETKKEVEEIKEIEETKKEVEEIEETKKEVEEIKEVEETKKEVEEVEETKGVEKKKEVEEIKEKKKEGEVEETKKECPYCDLSFPEPNALEDHCQKKHAFPCPRCSRAFQRQSGLTKHIRTHTKETSSETSSNPPYRYALTFSDTAKPGFSCSDLKTVALKINTTHPKRALVVNLTDPLTMPKNYEALSDSLRTRHKKKKTPFAPPPFAELPKACLLVIKNGVSFLLDDADAPEKLYNEQTQLRYDGKFFDKGRCKVRRSYKTLLFAKEGCKASDDCKQPTVIAFNEVPLLNDLRSALSDLLGDRPTGWKVDGTKYHQSPHEKGADGKPMKKPSNMGWHGDDGRTLSIGVCLGAKGTLSFVWRLPGSHNNCTSTQVSVLLNPGDVYVMSEKATGADFKSSSILRILHSVNLQPQT